MEPKITLIFLIGFIVLTSSVYSSSLIGEGNTSSARNSYSQRKLTGEQNERKELYREMYELARDGSDTSFSQLAEYTNNDDPELRRMATRALSRSKHKDTIKLLVYLISDKNKSVRGAAALSLGYQREESAYEALVSLLENDESSYVKGKAVYALGMLGTEDSLTKVISSLESDLRSVRVNAAAALGRTEDKKAVEPLISLLLDPEDKVRAAAAESLNILTGQAKLYSKTAEISVVERHKAWQGWWEENKDTFTIVRRSRIDFRSAKEWLERYDADKNGSLNEEELQAGLDDIYGASQISDKK